MPEKKIICSIYLRIILEFLVPGVLLTTVVFVISLFYTGKVAEYLRLSCLYLC